MADLADMQTNAQLVENGKSQIAATLAAALITASGKPHSIEQALQIKNDIYYAMYPSPNSGSYQAWAQTKDQRLKKVHGQF